MLDPWFYDVEIAGTRVVPGVGSPHTEAQLVADAEYKRDILVQQIVERYDFKSKSVLDIASNCGYWGLEYAKQGATRYLGVEGRPLFIDQGNMLWSEQSPKCNWQFLQGDINSNDTWSKIRSHGKFDFCLCAGILYHIVDHCTLLDRILEVTDDTVLVDTRVSPDNDPKTKPFIERGNWGFDGIHTNGKPATASHPTKQVLIRYFENKSFDVEEIRATKPVPLDMAANDNYDAGKRITLLCRKR